MRLPALFALAALVGLAACDSAKVSELTGAKPQAPATPVATAPGASATLTTPTPTPVQPAATAAATPGACPPAATPACPPAMAPEPVKAAPPVVRHARPRHVAWARPHHTQRVIRKVIVERRYIVVEPRVRHYAYSGGYVGEAPPPPPPPPPVYARPPQDGVYVERHYERRYEAPRVYAPPPPPPPVYDRGYAPRHAPYVDERSSYESSYSSSASSTYEHRESYVAPAPARDCNCQPQAAGRDRQGFLTWPGKQP